jgi:hypothetical protein
VLAVLGRHARQKERRLPDESYAPPDALTV